MKDERSLVGQPELNVALKFKNKAETSPRKHLMLPGESPIAWARKSGCRCILMWLGVLILGRTATPT
jgi:hypothetical protein